MSEDLRCDRTRRLIGDEGLGKLADSRVMVVGIGGVGSNCVEALARGGVGKLVIVDPDIVEESNMNRQAIAFSSTLGMPKVEVAARMIREIDPAADVVPVRLKVMAEDVVSFMEENPCDIVIDAQDTVTTKLALAKYCEERNIGLLSSMGAANIFDPTKLSFADIYETHSCPLSRIIRKQARKCGISRMQVLFSSEIPEQTSCEEGSKREDRSDLGTMSYMPSIMGQMLAARAICDILGVEWL